MCAVDAKSDPGRWAELRALNLLKRRGWRCLAERWSCRYGELGDVMSISLEDVGKLAFGSQGALQDACNLNQIGRSQEKGNGNALNLFFDLH